MLVHRFARHTAHAIALGAVVCITSLFASGCDRGKSSSVAAVGRPAGSAESGNAAGAIELPVRFDSAGHTWTRYTSLRWLRGRDAQWRDMQRVVIRERATEVCCEEAEHESHTVLDIDAFADTAIGKSPLWHAHSVADEGAIWNDLYRTTMRGCCGAADYLEFYNLRWGEALFRTSAAADADSSLPSLEVPNSPLERNIAFLDRYAAVQPTEAAADANLIGVLQYGGKQGPVQRVLFTGTDSLARAARLMRVAFVVRDTASSARGQSLWSSDGKRTPAALSGFRIRVEFSVDDERHPLLRVDIPVENDLPQLDRATRPANVKLSTAK